MEVVGLHHVSVNVADLDRSLAFYCDRLGLEPAPRPEIGVDGAWLDVAPGQQLHLVVGGVPSDYGQHLALEVDDLDATAGELRDAALKVRGPFPVGDTPIRQMFTFDPDGNRIEFTTAR